MTSTTPGSENFDDSTTADSTETIPDGSGTDASTGDEEQDTTSGGAPEDPEK
jgi:hypothetical protein